MMMAMIRDDLAALNVKHDVFFSERSLTAGEPTRSPQTIDDLRGKGLVYRGPAAAAEGRSRPRTGRTASRRCSAPPTSATTSTGR